MQIMNQFIFIVEFIITDVLEVRRKEYRGLKKKVDDYMHTANDEVKELLAMAPEPHIASTLMHITNIQAKEFRDIPRRR